MACLTAGGVTGGSHKRLVIPCLSEEAQTSMRSCWWTSTTRSLASECLRSAFLSLAFMGERSWVTRDLARTGPSVPLAFHLGRGSTADHEPFCEPAPRFDGRSSARYDWSERGRSQVSLAPEPSLEQ